MHVTVAVMCLSIRTFTLAAQAPAPSTPIRNFLQVTPDVCTGGQPRLEHLAELKTKGVKAVLNLRTLANIAPRRNRWRLRTPV